jgi:hypothetical protein
MSEYSSRQSGSTRSRVPRGPSERDHAGAGHTTASESGLSSALSTFRSTPRRDRAGRERRTDSDSLLRRLARWMSKTGKHRTGTWVVFALVVWIKWSVALGSYSGESLASITRAPASLTRGLNVRRADTAIARRL